MAKERKADHWTEARVFGMLKGPFPDGAYLRIPQVRNGTGYTRGRTTTADALIVSCWPSRGLYFAGVEIKVSPSDWKRELAKPGKAAEIQQWCHYWYVAAPVGVIPLGEVPPNWGLIECSARACKIVKAAPKLKPKPPDVCFVAAVLRAASDAVVPKLEVETLVEARAAEKVRWSNSHSERLREDVERFEKLTGVSIHSWEHGNIKAAVELVRQSKSTGVVALAEYLKRQAEQHVRLGCEVLSLCDEVLQQPNADDASAPVAKILRAADVDSD